MVYLNTNINLGIQGNKFILVYLNTNNNLGIQGMSAISWQELVASQLNDDVVHFVLDQNSWIFIVLAH